MDDESLREYYLASLTNTYAVQKSYLLMLPCSLLHLIMQRSTIILLSFKASIVLDEQKEEEAEESPAYRLQ